MSLSRVPRQVWAIAAGGALLDAGIGMILAIWPIHLTETLGASVFVVGLIEGIGDGITALMIFLGGLLSDRLGRRRLVLLAGEGLGALSRLGYALGAASLPALIGVRLVDRFGRSAVGAPRNALVGEAQDETQGKALCYGALYGVIALGAGAGPLVTGFIVAAGGDFATVAWVTVPLGLVGWAFYFLARDVGTKTPAAGPGARSLGDWRLLGPIIALGCLMNVAAVGWAFVLLKGRSVGLTEQSVAYLFGVLCLTQGGAGLLGGRYAEALTTRGALILGGLGMAATNILLAFATDAAAVTAAALLWGASWGVFNAVGTGLMFQAAAPARRASAFGTISFLHTLPLFVSGPLYGWLIDAAGMSYAFGFGALFALGVAATARLTIPSAWQ